MSPDPLPDGPGTPPSAVPPAAAPTAAVPQAKTPPAETPPALPRPAEAPPAVAAPAEGPSATAPPAATATATARPAAGGDRERATADLDGLAWRGVSPRYVVARRLGLAWTLLPLLAVLVVGSWLLGSTWWVVGYAGWALLAAWLWRLQGRQVRAIGYAEREDDLLVRRGILVTTLTVVPYGRMQFVDVSAGPLERRLGLASVQLHTASAATDAAVPGLPADEAARLRDVLAHRGEARLAGL